MVLTTRVWSESGQNAAALAFGAAEVDRYISRLRIRLPDDKFEEYAGDSSIRSALRVVNKSSKVIRVWFDTGLAATQAGRRCEDIFPSSTREWTATEDARKFYYIDVENLDTVADVAIGEVSYSFALVKLTPEVL